jgi:hypothetical protein
VPIVQPMVAAFGLVCIRSCGNIRLEVSNFKRHVRVFPSRLEFSSHFFHVGAFLLDFPLLPTCDSLPVIWFFSVRAGTTTVCLTHGCAFCTVGASLGESAV